jgi:hypothetical protein
LNCTTPEELLALSSFSIEYTLASDIILSSIQREPIKQLSLSEFNITTKKLKRTYNIYNQTAISR